MKRIIAFTHGETEFGPNPRLIDKGHTAVYSLRRYLPDPVRQVHAGMGARHCDVVNELGLGNNPNCYYSEVWGSATKVLEVPSRGVPRKYAFFAHGEKLAYDRYGGWADLMPAIVSKLRSHDVGDNDVICAGRDLMAALGVPIQEAKMAAAYEITVADNGHITHRLLGVADEAK